MSRHFRTSREEAQHNSLAARKGLSKCRGEVYLEYAQSAFDRGDLSNAHSYAEEGLLRSSGPFYLAVHDQLDDLKRKITLECQPTFHGGSHAQ